MSEMDNDINKYIEKNLRNIYHKYGTYDLDFLKNKVDAIIENIANNNNNTINFKKKEQEFNEALDIYKFIAIFKNDISIIDSIQENGDIYWRAKLSNLIKVYDNRKEEFENTKNFIKNNIFLSQITNIRNVENINIIKINKSLTDKSNYNFDDNIKILLKLINNDYTIDNFIAKGGQARVSELGKNFVVRISEYCYYKEDIQNNFKKNYIKNYIEKYNNLFSLKEGIKNNSTIPINNYIILDNNNNFITIEILKKREKGDLLNIRSQESGDYYSRRTKSEITSVSVMGQMIQSIKNLHYNGIIHKDIKSNNFLIDKNNKLTISDFGFANTIYNKENKVRGTQYYRAPELFKKTPEISQSNDIYSLGITFFKELLDDYYLKDWTHLFFCNKIIEADIIEPKNINLINFLPESILKNTKNKKNIKELKQKLIDLIKKMVIENPNERYRIFEVEEKFNGIIDFILKNFKDKNEKTLNIEDLLFYNKNGTSESENNQNEQKKIRNKILYRFGVFNNDTLKTKIEKYKNSMKKLLEREVRQQETTQNSSSSSNNNYNVIDEYSSCESCTLWDINKGNMEELKIVLNNLSKKESISQNTKDCLEILNNCIDDNNNNNIKLPSHNFYKLLDSENFKKNTKEYTMVLNKLIQLREIKLGIEISKIEELKKKKEVGSYYTNILLDKQIIYIKNLYRNIKIITEASRNTDINNHLYITNNPENLKKYELNLQNLDENITEYYLNGIFYERREQCSIIDELLDGVKDDQEKYKNTINELINEAIKNKYSSILNYLLKKNIITELNSEQINNCINIILSSENLNLDLIFNLIENLKKANKEVNEVINTIFNRIINFNILDTENTKNNYLNILNILIEQKLINLEDPNIMDGCINMIFKVEKPCLGLILNLLEEVKNDQEKYKNLIDILYNRAIENNNGFVLDVLFSNKELENNIKNIDNNNLIYDAIVKKKINIIKVLVKYGIKLKISNNSKNKNKIPANMKTVQNLNELNENLKQIARDFKLKNKYNNKTIKLKTEKYLFKNETEYTYIDKEDFDTINNLMELIGCSTAPALK